VGVRFVLSAQGSRNLRTPKNHSAKIKYVDTFFELHFFGVLISTLKKKSGPCDKEKTLDFDITD
jgi:hypothetical protein